MNEGEKESVLSDQSQGDFKEVEAVSSGILEQKVSSAAEEALGEMKEVSDVCEHPLTIKDLCGVCGKDLREKGGFPGQRTEQITANVSMIHHVPELLVSNKLSKEIGTKDREILLKGRKLALMVDLDQTLIHTSNQPPKPSEISSRIVGYRIYGCQYYTKIRPHAREFLERISQLYEMHIVTFGQRQYAHKIAEILDPEGKLFQKRILSRDELISSVHKTRNIKALFPVGDELLVMIDDRPDVWQYSDALIRVKPYRYFLEIGDINAPPPNLAQKPNGNGSVKGDGFPEEEQPTTSQCLGSEDSKAEEEDQSGGADKNVSSTSPPPTSGLEGPISEEDDTLVHIERILTDIHTQFYKHFDEKGTVKDVKQVIAFLRKQVLSGERIVFTGIIPREVDPRLHWLHKTCSQFGAKIDTQVGEQTTVVVAGRPGTDKMHTAKRLSIPIVSQDWLYACFHRWQRVDEKDFLFVDKEEEQKVREATDKRKITGMGLDASLSQMPTLGMDTMRRMSSEVDDALSEDDDDGEDEEEVGKDEEENTSSSDFDEMAADIENQLNSTTK